MTETNRTRNVAFRLTEDEYERSEKAATATGDDPNTWCRKLALAQSSGEHSFTKNERLIYKEIAALRYLVGHGFKLAFGRTETMAASWQKLTVQADQMSDDIVAELLSRRQPGPKL